MNLDDTRQITDTPLFDAGWYRANYPDVAASGLSPAMHYLKYGSRIGRNPGPHFDTNWYLAAYPDVAAAGLNPLLHYVRCGEAEGRLPTENRAISLDDRLWGGFSRQALQDLEALRVFAGASARERSYAAWALARWFAWQREWQRAGELLEGVSRGEQCYPDHAGPILLQSECLLRLGKREQAKGVLDQALKERGGLPELFLAYANTYLTSPAAPTSGDHDHSRLAWINRIFQGAGLALIEKTDPDLPLTMDNLSASSASTLSDQALPKISVIVPAFNARRTIGTALRGLLNQTWPNLEVLVVDDCSKDGTMDVVSAFAREDQRVIPLLHSHNQGAYAARNTGLRHAKGDYVTTHDSDDWSHPQKLELQARAFASDPRLSGVAAHWVRASSRLHFGRWRMEESLLHRSMSSFMFTRSAFEALGGWDRVTVNADTEYFHRAIAVFGRQAVAAICPHVPLAFARFEPGSLTSNQPTHLRTQFFGLRRDYHESALWWHANVASKKELHLPLDKGLRPFAAPLSMLPEREGSVRCKLLVIADFGGGEKARSTGRDLVLKALRRGDTVALFHWPDYTRQRLLPIDSFFYRLAAGGRVAILSPGQEVEAETVVMCDGELARFLIDGAPCIAFSRFLVIDCRTMPDTTENAAPHPARAHLRALFGTEGEWPTAAQMECVFPVALSGNHPDDLTRRDDTADIALVAGSHLFDRDWYLDEYGDVAGEGADPAAHYARDGAREGRNPGPWFDTRWYLSEYDDVRQAGMNPLIHYLRYGQRLGRHAMPKRISDARERVRAAAGQIPAKPRVLYVLSTRTGGVPQTNQDLMSALEDRIEAFVLYSSGSRLTLAHYRNGVYVDIELRILKEPVKAFPHRSSEYDAVVSSWLTRYAIKLVHIRHIAWHGLGLIDASKALGLPVVFSFHDFYTVCPTVKLLDEQYQYCGGACTGSEGRCEHELWTDADFPPLKNAAINEWKRAFADMLGKCDVFITTSESTKETMTANYPFLKERPFHVIPHGRDFERFERLAAEVRDDEPIRIVAPGSISRAKGAEVVAGLGRISNDAGIEVHVIGNVAKELSGAEGVVFHGPYARGEFNALIREIRPHVGGIFSIWPETYCHTLTELWSCGVPVIAFDFGAIGERVRKSGGGWLTDEPTVPGVVAVLQALRRNPGDSEARIEAIIEWQRKAATMHTCGHMGKAYYEHYGRLIGER